MARIDNLSITLEIPGILPMTLTANYCAEVDVDRLGNMGYSVKLGYIETRIDGKHIADLEGSEIPDLMRILVLAKIPRIPEADLAQALADEAEESVFECEHAAGAI